MKKEVRMNKSKQFIFEGFQILIGIILASIGLKAFLLPNGFLDGGVTGIAILINELFEVNVSIILLIINLPFLALAWFTLDKKIVLKSFLSIVILAVFIQFENFNSLTSDKLLIAIFGGIFLGAGIGVTIKNGAVLDGSEILGIYINNRFGISIGKTVLFFNVILFAFTALFISVETAMYSTLTFLITAKIIDLIIEGFEDYVGLMIVSEKVNLIEEKLSKQIGVGITMYKGTKGHGKSGIQEQKEIIHTVINRIDIKRTYKIIEEIDKNPFIIEFDVNSVKGGVLKKYLGK